MSRAESPEACGVSRRDVDTAVVLSEGFKVGVASGVACAGGRAGPGEVHCGEGMAPDVLRRVADCFCEFFEAIVSDLGCDETGRACERYEPGEDGFGDERRGIECPVVAGFADAGAVGVVVSGDCKAEVGDIDPLPFHFSCFGHSDTCEEAKSGERDEFGEMFFDDSESMLGV